MFCVLLVFFSSLTINKLQSEERWMPCWIFVPLKLHHIRSREGLVIKVDYHKYENTEYNIYLTNKSVHFPSF